MARFTCTLGRIQGKLGDHVYYILNGKQYVRTLPSTDNPVVSVAQARQRSKWKLATSFAKTLTPLIKASHPERHKLSPYNLLMKALLRHSITQDNNVFRIDYSTVKISRGSLRPAFNAAVSCLNGILQFGWYYDDGIDCIGAHNDKAILVAYCPALNESIYIGSETDRSSGKALLDVTAFTGHEVHTWLGFVSADERKAADSVYVGMVRVT
jgi:hypothetical protein